MKLSSINEGEYDDLEGNDQFRDGPTDTAVWCREQAPAIRDLCIKKLKKAGITSVNNHDEYDVMLSDVQLVIEVFASMLALTDFRGDQKVIASREYEYCPHADDVIDQIDEIVNAAIVARKNILGQ